MQQGISNSITDSFFLLEHLPIGICIADPELNIEYWNLQLVKWTGYQLSEVRGDSLGKLFPNLNEHKYLSRIRQVVSGGPSAIFSSQLHPHLFPIQMKDGSLRIQSTAVSAFQDDTGRQHLMFSIQDVTETFRHLRRIKDLRRQALDEVAERKKAEEALRSSQELLTSITRNIRDGIFRARGDGELIYVNESFARMTGMIAHEVKGRKISDFFVDQKVGRGLQEKVHLKGTLDNEEIQFKRLDGKQFWCLMSMAAIKDGGEIVFYDGAITDINDRKLDNERLRESEAQYRNLFENSSIGMYRCDIRTGRVMKANRKALEIMGYDQLSASLSAKQLFVRDLGWKRVYTMLLRKGEFEDLEVQFRRDDGKKLWIRLSARHFPDEQFFEGVLVDITERKRAEMTKNALYEVANKTAVVNDFDKYLNEISTITTKLLGVNNLVIAEFDEQNQDFEYKIIIDEELAPDDPAFTNKTLLELGFNSKEILILSGDDIKSLILNNEIEPLKLDINQWMAAPLSTVNRHLGVIAACSYDEKIEFGTAELEVLTFVAQNISTAMERRQNQEDMERAVRLAEAANHAKSMFLANMSHELRTPLNSIIGFNRRLLKKAVREQDSSSESALSTIRRNAESLLTMINDVLDLSKVEAGKITYHFSSTSLHAIANQVVEELEPLATAKNLKLYLEGSPAIRSQVDPDRLKQVLINIVGNAIKFTDEGKVSIAISQRMSSGVNIIDIEDTGIGIAAERLNKIFESFEQADPTSHHSRGGTGLGLAIAKRLTEGMKGTVTVRSTLGTGTCFTLKFPTIHV